MEQACKNCGHFFNGKYCNQCGEKVIENKDFTLKHIIGQAIGSITNLDAKFYQSFKLLLFYPGRLSLKYVQGIRKPYMQPFQIFVICNLLFFIFLSEIDIFRTPSKWYFQENFDGVHVLDKVKVIAIENELTQDEVAILYDNKSSAYAKGLIVFLIPFIALISWLLNLKKQKNFGMHIIMATHYFSFVLLMSVLWTELVSLLFNPNRWLFIIPISFFMILHYVISTKYFYNNKWTIAILKGFAGVLLINICIQFYRVSINLLTLNTL